MLTHTSNLAHRAWGQHLHVEAEAWGCGFALKDTSAKKKKQIMTILQNSPPVVTTSWVHKMSPTICTWNSLEHFQAAPQRSPETGNICQDTLDLMGTLTWSMDINGLIRSSSRQYLPLVWARAFLHQTMLLCSTLHCVTERYYSIKIPFLSVRCAAYEHQSMIAQIFRMTSQRTHHATLNISSIYTVY